MNINNHQIDLNDINYVFDTYTEEMGKVLDSSYSITFDGRIVAGTIEQYMRTVSVLSKLCSEAYDTTPVSDFKPNTAYAIAPDGTSYKCGIYNHIGFFIYLALHTDRNIALKCMLGGESVIEDIFMGELKYITFSTDGKGSCNFRYIGDRFTRAQHDRLLQIFEINGQGREYFRLTELEDIK